MVTFEGPMLHLVLHLLTFEYALFIFETTMFTFELVMFIFDVAFQI